jgi:hypothetical protein
MRNGRLGFLALTAIGTIGAIGSATTFSTDASADRPSQREIFTHQSPHTALHFQEPINVQKLQAIRARQPKPCGPMEVAPGVWVKMECHLYNGMSQTRLHASPQKLKLIRQHKVHLGRRMGASAALATSRLGALHQPGAGAPPTAPRPGESASGGSGGGAAVGSEQQPPASVDHRVDQTEGPVKNQGYVGACTAFSLSTAVDNAVRRAGKTDIMSPTHLWSNYGVPQMGTAGDANLNKLITTMATWPYSGKEACKIAQSAYEDCGEAYGVVPGTGKEDPMVVANKQRADDNGLYKIASVEKFDVGPPDMDEITTTLASGSDLWIAMKIDGSNWTNRKMDKTFTIPDWSEVSGGHAVVMSGYRDTPHGRQFLIHNSWGESWGDHGYAWVSEAMVNRYMHYAYKIKLADTSPPQSLTDDDCSATELIDVGSGKCAEMCPDYSRRNNGNCGG